MPEPEPEHRHCPPPKAIPTGPNGVRRNPWSQIGVTATARCIGFTSVLSKRLTRAASIATTLA